MNTNLPKDPMILLSYLNTQLRDFYPSLAALCEALSVEEQALSEPLAAVGYHYDAAVNQFK